MLLIVSKSFNDVSTDKLSNEENLKITQKRSCFANLLRSLQDLRQIYFGLIRCNHFCVVNLLQCSNGYLHVMPCAPGTVFNPAIGVCDHPYNVPGCGGTQPSPTTTTTQPTTPQYNGA